MSDPNLLDDRREQFARVHVKLDGFNDDLANRKVRMSAVDLADAS